MSKIIIVSAIAILSTLVYAGVPEGKETITLDSVPGDKGSVQFPHAKHIETLKCGDCHHHGADTKPQACSNCHIKGGKAMNDVMAPEPSKELFHKACSECHKENARKGKAISGCNTCHKKK